MRAGYMTAFPAALNAILDLKRAVYGSDGPQGGRGDVPGSEELPGPGRQSPLQNGQRETDSVAAAALEPIGPTRSLWGPKLAAT